MSSKDKDVPSARLRRDVRVDRLGFVKELADQYGGPIRDAMKAAMEEGERVEGDFFEGLLAGSTSTTINKAALLRMYEAKKLTKAEFLDCIEGSVSGAKRRIDPKLLKTLCKTSEGSCSLRIARKKGVQVELVDALKALNAEILK
jgi:hypothetical protein